MKSNDGLIYEGEWKQGLKHGYGRESSGNSCDYYGEWHYGRKNGKGMLHEVGKKYVQVYTNGILMVDERNMS